MVTFNKEDEQIIDSLLEMYSDTRNKLSEKQKEISKISDDIKDLTTELTALRNSEDIFIERTAKKFNVEKEEVIGFIKIRFDTKNKNKK